MTDNFWNDDNLRSDETEDGIVNGIDDDEIEYCGECDCEACRAYYEEYGVVPDVDCEAARSRYINCKCNSCTMFSGDADSAAGEPSAPKRRAAAGSASPIAAFADNYTENLINPESGKVIDPKKMYITLAATVLGSVLLFLFLGWLLCYATFGTTGFKVEDFITKYNAIVSSGDIMAQIDESVSNASDSDVLVIYPDFDSIVIPEGADLRKGVLLCNGEILMQAKVRNGEIVRLTVTLSDECDRFNSEDRSFSTSEETSFDYSNLNYFTAVGKARLACYNVLCDIYGVENTDYSLAQANSSGIFMHNYAYYYYQSTGYYSEDMTYFEYSENASMSFDPTTFTFTLDSIQKTIIDPHNGIYTFFDGIFGEKEEAVSDDSAAVGSETENNTVVSSDSDSVSASDAE